MNTSPERIEEVAALMFELQARDSSGEIRWTWDMANDNTKQYWRNFAKVVANVFARAGRP